MFAAGREQRRPGRQEGTALRRHARGPASRRSPALCDRAAASRIRPRRHRDRLRGAANEGRGQSAPPSQSRRDRCFRPGGSAVALRPRPVAGYPRRRRDQRLGGLRGRVPHPPCAAREGHERRSSPSHRPYLIANVTRPDRKTEGRDPGSALARVRADGGRRRRSGARGLWRSTAAETAATRRRYARRLRRRSAGTRPRPGRERPGAC